jgi:small subunit ribosomal protein S13
MARIAGVDLPKNKKVEYALPYIFGIGLTSSRQILETTGVNPLTRVKDLSDNDINKIAREIQDNYKVEGDLKKERMMNIKRLMDIGCYRGLRHRRCLPVNGQRTKTNARTRKGAKRTVGARRKKK